MSAYKGDRPLTPLRFTPSMETPEENEAETNAGLIEQLGKISQTTFEHSGHAIRSVHAKSHGVVRGELTVLDALPPELAQGLFAKPGCYTTAMRFSTLPGDILDDSVSTPRGLAVKVIGVEGPRLPGSEGDVTQDFVMVNGPAFSAPTAAKFLGNLKMLAATTDKAEGLKKVVSAVARGTESVIEAFGGKSPTITTMGGQPETHILGETFYSQVPILYGDYIAKFSVQPIFDVSLLKDTPIDTNGRPNALRDAVAEYFATKGGEWEFRVQLCTDPGCDADRGRLSRLAGGCEPLHPRRSASGRAAAFLGPCDSGGDRRGAGVQPMARPSGPPPARFGDAGTEHDLHELCGVSGQAQWLPDARAEDSGKLERLRHLSVVVDRAELFHHHLSPTKRCLNTRPQRGSCSTNGLPGPIGSRPVLELLASHLRMFSSAHFSLHREDQRPLRRPPKKPLNGQDAAQSCRSAWNIS